MVTSPVYTTENECQDCYKCVRHCPVKAIRIVNGKASVIPEACVACGECVKVCPAHAKKIRSDLARLKELVASGAKLYASIAPSFAGYFKGVTIGQIAAALKTAGFAGVSETAHGAESVSAHVAKLLQETDSPLVISSACPAAVDMVRKYLPGYAAFISPLPSPVRAHCRLIKEQYGHESKVVFFGPCAAKKNESDAHPDELALGRVLTALEQMRPAEREPAAARAILERMMRHDRIEFVIGTKVNESHQDPNVPQDLELRRSVVKRIAAALEKNYRKKVTVDYY